MALSVCANDLVSYSIGAPACPQCGETDRVEQGSAEHLAALAPEAKPAKKTTAKPATGSTSGSTSGSAPASGEARS